MNALNFEFDKLVSLLGHSENDPEIKDFFGQQMSNIARDEYYGTLEFKPYGVDVVFKQASWVLPSEKVVDPKRLYLSAFHLYRDGYGGFVGYRGKLPNNIAFDDPEAEVLRKMGRPLKIGGGGMSRVTEGVVPRWFWFSLGEAILHIQFDSSGRVDLVKLRVPDVKPAG